jgi:hypothetical protein
VHQIRVLLRVLLQLAGISLHAQRHVDAHESSFVGA